MRVRIRVTLAGPQIVYHAGEIYEIDDENARRIIAAGFAEPVGSEPALEEPPRPRRRRGAVEVETTMAEAAEER